MWKAILGWIVKSKGAKVGGGVLGGSGVLAALIAYGDVQVKRVDYKIEAKDAMVRQYVDLKDQNLLIEIGHLKEGQLELKRSFRAGQNEVKDLLKIMNTRLFDMKGR